MNPTIADVAKYVGVSKSTVSQFINHRYNFMSADTQKKIREAIDELGYRPNQVAKSLKQKKTNMIAVVCATLSSRFSLELISAIEAYLQTKKYSIVIARTDDNSEKERKLIESFISRQIDGIIVFPTAENKDYYNDLRKNNFPIVFVDRFIKGVNVQSVLLDNKAAGKLAAQQLIKKGHRDIAIVTFPLGDNITTRVERVAGYTDALESAGIEVQAQNIISCHRQEIESRLNTLFLNTAKHPTGLVLTNDILLEESLIWIKKNNIKIPSQLSLISIDDVSFAHFFNPAITTIEQPVEKIGEYAAELLVAKIDNIDYKYTDENQIRLSPRLIEGDSIN